MPTPYDEGGGNTSLMSITNQTSGTRVDEIAAGIYRISTPVPPDVMPRGFMFTHGEGNQIGQCFEGGPHPHARIARLIREPLQPRRIDTDGARGVSGAAPAGKNNLRSQWRRLGARYSRRVCDDERVR